MLLRILPFKSTASLVALVALVDAVYDPYWYNNTARLFHCETMYSEKDANFSGSYGDFSVSSAQAKFGTKSWNFASGGGIQFAPIVTGSNDFTLELWLRPTSIAPACVFFETRSNATSGWALVLTAAGAIQLYNAGVGQTASTANITVNNWSHVALVKTGSTIAYYINGTFAGNATTSISALATEQIFFFGRNYAGSSPYIGFIDEIRFTMNLARYSSNFTPATKRFSDGNDLDYYWQNTVALLPMDGANGSVAVTDVVGHTVTNGGGVLMNNTNQLFAGVNTANFDGGGNSYLVMADSEEWTITQPNAYQGGNYTWECWIRPGSLVNPVTIFGGLNAGNICLLQTTNGGFALYLNGSSNNGFSTATGLVGVNTWYHIALVKQGGQWSLYRNGVQVATNTYAGAITNATGNFGIGITPGIGWIYNGRMADFRVTKGVARYTSNFAVPTKWLPRAPTYNLLWEYTTFLGQFEGAIGATSFTDSSKNPKSISNSGSAILTNSQVRYGSTSLRLAADSYIAIPASAFPSGTQDFTMAMWVRMNSFPAYHIPLVRGANGVNGFALVLASNGTTFDFSYNSSSNIWTTLFQKPYTFSLNIWYHIAITRQGSEYRIFVNGVHIGRTSDATAISAATVAQQTGISPDGTQKFDGWIDDFELIVGAAKYVGDFRLPSQLLLAPPA